MNRILPLGAALAAGLALMSAGGCGFQPLYAGPGYASLPGLSIESGEDRFDYLVDAALRRHLGDGDSPYRLVLSTRLQERPIGISASGVARRYSLMAQTRYSLERPGAAPVRGLVSETVQFDAPGDPAALIAARSDAETRAARVLAERLAQSMTAELRRRERAPNRS
ncbi:MAG: LPS assembly lipoprotein LptE [Oceanicaulis sp.]